MLKKSLLLLPMAIVVSSCLFLPNIEGDGYTSCDDNADCDAGRSCEKGYCAPPPWNDERFITRNLLSVQNLGDEVLPAGSAVPVRFAPDGVLETSDIGIDGRFSFFTDAEGTLIAGEWREVPTFFDLYDDALIAWMPTQVELQPQQSAQLAWLESETGENEANALIDPNNVFQHFEEFDTALDEERFKTFGTGEPNIREGVINIADNQKLVFDEALTPPFSLTFRGRINGAACDALYIGLEGDNNAGYSAPSMGLFALEGLNANAEVAPEEDSVPTPVEQNIPLDTAEHRYRFDVGAGQIRIYIDDEEVAAPDLRPPFANQELYAVVDVDGACSFDIERFWVTPLPLEGVKVEGQARVVFGGFE